MPSSSSLTRRGLIIAALGAVSGAVYASVSGRDESSPLHPAGPAGSRTGSGPLASGASSAAPPSTSSPAVGSGAFELPRGGRVVLPVHRLVGYCGWPGSAALGRLGIGDLDTRIRELERLGRAYATGRVLLPVLELIAVVVQPRPGADGRYRVRTDPDVIGTYLDAARRHHALLLLNVQPGRARFMDEARALEPWLRAPDVGLALDPEWAVRGRQVPGRVFGQTTGQEIDSVATYLSALVAAGNLPEKVLVVHQLAPRIIHNLSALRPHPGVAVVKSVDGIGPPPAKIETWRRLITELPAGMRPGFKLFLEEDAEGPSRLMTPSEVMALRPEPEYVMYE